MLSFGFGVGLGFFFGGMGGFDISSAVEFVHGADNNEDNEGNEEKVDDVLEEVAVSDVGDGVGTEEVWDVEGETREVETAGEETRNRHDDVVNEGFNNGGKGATDGDTDGEVNDAATIDKLFEFLDEIAFGNAGDDAVRSSASDRGAMFGSVWGGCL